MLDIVNETCKFRLQELVLSFEKSNSVLQPCELGQLTLAGMPLAADAAPSRSDQFVDVSTMVPDAVFDVRYAGTDNFVGARVDGYGAPRCFLWVLPHLAHQLRCVVDIWLGPCALRRIAITSGTNSGPTQAHQKAVALRGDVHVKYPDAFMAGLRTMIDRSLKTVSARMELLEYVF